MNYLLNIDTTSENALVNLCKGPEVISSASNNISKEHAAFLHVSIHKLLKDNSICPSDLKAIGVSGGPGSYTGIRVGLATAKGLCYALNIPMMMYNSLELMAFSALETQKNKKAFYCPMIDARRMEVYAAIYDANLDAVISPAAMEIDENSFAPIIAKNPTYFFGSGAKKFENLIKNPEKNAHFLENSISSDLLGLFGWNKFQKRDFVSLIDSKPLYLKEFYTTAKLT